ncbi:MAG: hypothetical protein Q4P29_07290 [Tissierellia bacterium]|nr:hypothetical protein [Tissierellia bacterium]
MYSLLFLHIKYRFIIQIINLIAFILQIYLINLTNFSTQNRLIRLREILILIYQGIISYFIFKYSFFAKMMIMIPRPRNFKYELLLITIITIIIIIRALVLNLRRIKYLRNSISPISVRNAIDTLDSGLLFYDNYGGLILLNDSMAESLKYLFGRVFRNGRKIWKAIKDIENSELNLKREIGDSIVLKIKDKYYQFTHSIISYENKYYNQILAADITNLIEKTEILELKEKELTEAMIRFNQMQKDIAQIVEEREKMNVKIKLHDYLGQKLTMLQSFLKSSIKAPDMISSLSLRTVIDDIKKSSETNPAAAIYDIIDFFNGLGIKIEVVGAPPNNKEIVKIQSQIIREALNNALLHSDATEIKITSTEDDKGYTLIIENNGKMPQKDIVEGGGLKGIRYRLSKIGGSLFIEIGKTFKITVLIAK